MLSHLRANLVLALSTVVLCCVAYPLVLWAVGQTIFPSAADGSLVKDADGKVRGSRLIAQPFGDAKYFQPRPSAASYNASASGGSNLGASNPKLRGRVAQALGTIARYKKDGPRKGAPVGADVEAWFQTNVAKKRDLVSEWVAANPSLVTEWGKSSDLVKAYVSKWADDNPDVQAALKKEKPSASEPFASEDLAPFFFASYVKKHPGTWPCTVEVEVEKDGKKVKEKVVRPATAGDDVRQIFFDTWLRENPKGIDPLQDLEQVPADLVLASGSGLDPHVTLRGARYQLDGVVDARAQETGKPAEEVRGIIEKLLKEKSFRPLGGLAGEPLVNVLELNLALDEKLKLATK